MNQDNAIFLIGTIYRVVCLLVGFGFAYLGYRLYVKGVLEKEGEISGKSRGWKVALKNVAPGVVFATLGVIIAALGIVRPITSTVQNGGIQSLIGERPLSKLAPLIANPSQDDTVTIVGVAVAEAKLKDGSKLTSSETKTLTDWIDGELKKPPCPVLESGSSIDRSMSYKFQTKKHWWEFWKPDSPFTIEPR